jgi:SAM-dependent methyltransferase
MTEYWESRFKNEGTMWKSDPSDSAIMALELFINAEINDILIPGFGYGRNAKIFIDRGFDVVGIEISKSAIDLARMNSIDCKIHHGSVTSMPYDNKEYGGIFCYALIHLLNRNERRSFLSSCYNQLKSGGLMIFVVATVENSMFGNGKLLSRNRYQLSSGLNVYFYDDRSVENEFTDFGITLFKDIEEPVKFMTGAEPVKLKFVICRKRS